MKLIDTTGLQVISESTADILNGVLLILKYQPISMFSAEHDTIYFGYYDVEEMTKEDFEKMISWGWFEQYESWSHLV